MPTLDELDRAVQLATDYAAEKYGRAAVVEAAECPDGGFYGFDSEGWAIFVVLEGYRVGSSEYIAVNMETGETRALGRYGE